MKRILQSELKLYVGQQVFIQGWLHKKRILSSKLAFLIIRDRTGLIQVVIENSQIITQIKNLQIGSILKVTGHVKLQSSSICELLVKTIEIQVEITEASPVELDKPLSHEPDSLDSLFKYRPIGLRSVQEQMPFITQTELVRGFRSYLEKESFMEFRSPKLISKATEGGAETFTVPYFDKEATLAQSAQFYKQIMVGVFERVFELGATYRAEKSFTPRHMTEFTTLDVEMGFIDSFEDILETAQDMIRHSFGQLSQLQETNLAVPSSIPKIPLHKLHEIYFHRTGIDLRGEADPTPDQEREICQYAQEKFGSDFVYITHFPACDMKFYHALSEESPEYADRADLLFRGIEIATLSKREHRYDILINQMKCMGIDPNDEGFTTYLMAFKHGMPPHGGFGLGIERITAKVCQLRSVKEATLFPRDVRRLNP